MKRIAKTLLGCVCVLSVIIAGCENLDGSLNVIWTLSWIAYAALCAYGWNKLEEAE